MRHSLSQIDSEARTGTCSICGPVRVYQNWTDYKGKRYYSWRCGRKIVQEAAIRAKTEKGRKSSRTRTARYREANREKCLEATKRWKKENPEHVALLRRTWYENNYERELENNARRRVLELDAFVEKVDRLAVFKRDKGRCGICGKKVTGRFHIDHIIPLTRGGLHSMENVQLSHASCNLRKYTEITLP